MAEKTHRQDSSAPLGVGRASKAGNNRTAGSEQFYTPVAQAAAHLSEVQKVIPEEDWGDAHWVEPSGGTGAFIDALLGAGVPKDRITSFDIQPKHDLVQEANFLTDDIEFPEVHKGQKTIVIGNPPFGRNSSLSVPFFNRSVELGADYIGFIIPKSWRKWTIERRLDRTAHKIFDMDLSVDYIDEKGAPTRESTGGLSTVFQIWKVDKAAEPRPRGKVVDRGLLKKVSPAEADVAVVVFGYSCGKLLWDGEFDCDKSVTTTIYLKVPSETVREALRTIEKDKKFEKFSKNVAFVDALSLEELNYLVCEELRLDPWERSEGESVPGEERPQSPVDLSGLGGFGDL